VFPRHATDVISLVFGTIFAGFTVVWLLTVNGVIEEDQAWVGGPITLIAAGLVGLAAAL
jgi:drug/metabolite transporter superfamily protein YnfA